MTLGFLGDLLGLNAGNATKDAAGQNKQVIAGYDTKGTGIIDKGSAAAGEHLTQAGDLYNPLLELGESGVGLYGDALGVNGAEGSTRATEAYRTSPGFEFQMEQGLDALERRASAQGRVASGQTRDDTLRFATGLADQNYSGWLDRLGGTVNTYAGGAAGKAGSLSDLANLDLNTLSQRLGLAGDVASGYMDTNNQFADGEEANKAGIASLGKTAINIAGKAFGYGA